MRDAFAFEFVFGFDLAKRLYQFFGTKNEVVTLRFIRREKVKKTGDGTVLMVYDSANKCKKSFKIKYLALTSINVEW